MYDKTRYLLVVVVALIAIGAKCDDSPTRPGPLPGGECGTVAGIGCPEGQTCELPTGECFTSDLRGICVLRPEVCTQEYDPVCGCDGVTYGNDCTRLAAGVQKRHDGECS